MSNAAAFIGDIGGPEVFAIAVLALLLFGAKRLPEVGRAAGRAMREFKRATSGVEENLREVLREPATPSVRPAARQVPSAVNPPRPASATKKSDPAPPPAKPPASATPPSPDGARNDSAPSTSAEDELSS